MQYVFEKVQGVYIRDMMTFLLFFLYELLMSFCSSRKLSPPIVLPCGRFRELILVSDQFQ